MSYHHSIDTALQKIRQDIAKVLSPEAIVEACHQAGHHWRNRTLTPSVIIHWFIQQVLLQNTSAQHVSLLSNREFTDSAYCQARSGLPLTVFHTLLRNLTSAVQSQTRADGLWRGHRTFLVDGSAVSMPDTKELQLQFGQPGAQTKGCGFPVAKILAMFHSATGLLMEIAIAPLRTHEMSQISQMHPSLKAGDVLVGDRGFCSFAHLAMLIGQPHTLSRAMRKIARAPVMTPRTSGSVMDAGEPRDARDDRERRRVACRGHACGGYDERRGPYFTAKTQIDPPSGTSGYLPGNVAFRRPCMARESTPQPDCTATY